MVLLQLVFCHHVIAVGCGQWGTAKVQNVPAVGGAMGWRTGVWQSRGEVGTAGDGHVDLRLGGWGSDVKFWVQIWLLLLMVLLLLGPYSHTDHSSRGHVWFDENIVDYRRHAEDGGEVWQSLGDGGGDGAGHLQPRFCLDLLGSEGFGVGPIETRAEMVGAWKYDVDVEAVRGSEFVFWEVFVDYRGALSSVLLVTSVSRGTQERTVDLGEVFVQI